MTGQPSFIWLEWRFIGSTETISQHLKLTARGQTGDIFAWTSRFDIWFLAEGYQVLQIASGPASSARLPREVIFIRLAQFRSRFRVGLSLLLCPIGVLARSSKRLERFLLMGAAAGAGIFDTGRIERCEVREQRTPQYGCVMTLPSSSIS